MRASNRGWVVLGFVGVASIAACDDGGGTGGGGATPTSTSTSSGSTTSTSTASSTASSTSASGTSSSSSSSSTGSGVAAAECMTAGDCKTSGNCCTCESIPANDMLPACGNTGCMLDKCMEGGLPPGGGGGCVVGRCNAGFDCDSTHVACLTPTPQCPPGEVPSVKGACWGTCIKASECAYVDACAACGPTQACVHYGGGVMKTYCVEVAAECGGKASCACMGQSLCGAVPCGEQNGELTCQAP